MLDLIAAKALSEVTAYLSGEMHKLEQAGADVGLFASRARSLSARRAHRDGLRSHLMRDSYFSSERHEW